MFRSVKNAKNAFNTTLRPTNQPTDEPTDQKVVHSTNKAGYTATLVACGWAGALLEKVNRASGQKPYSQKAQKR